MTQKDKLPLFSVLVAAYNREPYIKESIESALAQDYENIEIIVVDDGSTDNTLKIVKQMASKDKRIKVFENGKNMGCGYTKNRCGYEAKGEICGYLDPDDILEKSAVSDMIKAHLENQDIVLFHPLRMRCFYDNNQEKYIEISAQKVDYKITSILELPAAINHFSTFKRSAFVKMGGTNPEVRRAVDRDLYYRLEEVGGWSYIDVCNCKYRIHDKGLSTKANSFKANYWHIKIAENAAVRRGLDPEMAMSNVLRHYIRAYAGEENKKILHSFSYKLGRFITCPGRLAKKFLS